jgi:hypothetical protein
MDEFTTLTDESYWFYNHTVELRYDKVAHAYFRVDPELGNLIELHGVTTVLRIIDKSNALVPWASKKCAEKILRTIPLSTAKDEFGDIMLAPITLADFTKLVMEAKSAHKDILEDAGDIGKAAHECLEHSIQFAIDHTQGVVLELRNLPTDEKAKTAAEAGFTWMRAHGVVWLKTECKIYSKEYGYAGTLDGKARVSACDDPACCSERFVNSLSVIDWKSSNALHVEYIFQAAGAYCHAEVEEYGEDIQNCFILRLGKNEEEAGKFEPWRVPASDFHEAFLGFLACLNLVELLEDVKARMSTQKKGVREIKKQQKAEQKEIDKMKAKVELAAAKAQMKLVRASEKERIKADAKKSREEAKRAKNNPAVQELQEVQRADQAEVQVPAMLRQVGSPEQGQIDAALTAGVVVSAEAAAVCGDSPIVADTSSELDQALPVCESVRIIPQDSAQNPVLIVVPQDGGILVEESVVVRKPFVIPEEG